MSRRTIRQAVADYLNAGLDAIPALQIVYKAMPPWVGGAMAFNLAEGAGHGAFAFLHLADSDETRWAMPYVLASVGVHYNVQVAVCYVYEIPSAQVTDTYPDDWSDGCDDILQGLKDRIHADPQLGAPGLVFQAAQTPLTLRITSEDPKATAGRVYSWHVLEFQLTEAIVA